MNNRYFDIEFPVTISAEVGVFGHPDRIPKHTAIVKTRIYARDEEDALERLGDKLKVELELYDSYP